MKTVLKERTVKFNFKGVDDRRFYLERMAAQVNNDLLDRFLTAMDRSRFYNVQISCLKLIHEMDKDSTLEDLEDRLAELEGNYNKAKDFSNNRE